MNWLREESRCSSCNEGRRSKAEATAAAEGVAFGFAMEEKSPKVISNTSFNFESKSEKEKERIQCKSWQRSNENESRCKRCDIKAKEEAKQSVGGKSKASGSNTKKPQKRSKALQSNPVTIQSNTLAT